MKIKILIPIFNDWNSVKLLIKNIDIAIKDINADFSVIIVNDASTQEKPDNILSFRNLKSIKIICSVVPRISCLVRASVLKIIFSETKNLIIYIGIRENEFEDFESHAWVALEKKVILNDEKIRSYKTIYTI